MEKATINIKVQRWVAIVSVLLFAIKLVAYFLTLSVAILSDALESIVNIVAALIGLYSLHIAAQPRDEDHPYGHGKVEYISAAIEGVLICVAGVAIIYKGIKELILVPQIHQIDYGIILIAATAIINYILGAWCVSIGKKNSSLALTSSGKHLISDTITTVGIVIGLILVALTNLYWIDSVIALLVACILIYTGFKIIVTSIEGIMDKADTALLKTVIATLEDNRQENWIDLHNLRILKYGSILHLDAHLTVPWYLNVNEAHVAIDELSALVKNKFGESVELFVHTDGCLNFSCTICTKKDCNVRQQAFVQKVNWNVENVISNKKHGAL
jgi:cation diffusion facilitator family transporter